MSRRDCLLPLLTPVILGLVLCKSVTARDTLDVALVTSQQTETELAVASGFAHGIETMSGSETRQHWFVHDQMDSAALLESIAELSPDALLTMGTPATRLIRADLPGQPSVFAMVLAPENSRLSPPGVSVDLPIGARLALLRQALRRNRFGVCYTEASRMAFEQIRQVAAAQGVEIVGGTVHEPGDFSRITSQTLRRVDAFIMLPDPTLYTPASIAFLLREGLRSRTPIIGLSSSYTRSGALISFEVDAEDVGLQAAELWHQGDRTIEMPRTLAYSVNLAVAQTINIVLPDDFVDGAFETVSP